ncbi:MAG: DUF72 domain-containing protein [Pelovirga sp.]
MCASSYIGTSGWQYDHWRGPFYSKGVNEHEMLAYYSQQFDAVEINNSFYRLPSLKAMEGWSDSVSSGFLFAVKASRYITHMKKLKDAEDSVNRLIERVEILGERLAPVLFQLPPNWRCNPQRLTDFLAVLPKGYRYAFEFRDTSWFDDRIYHLLEEAGAAFCIYDLAGCQSPKRLTAEFVYVRLHGPDAAYQGSYPVDTLCGWAGALCSWARQGKDIFCFFDNDQQGYAPQNALKLKTMLSAD